jgi:hypothetical protein
MSLPFNKSDIDHLEGNAAWREIVRTIEERKDLLQSDFRKLNPMSPEGGYAMALIQGQLNELDWLLQQPETMEMEVAEALTEKNREEEN